MSCRICGYHDGHHDTKTPRPEVSDDRVSDMLVWDKGYEDGRSGEPESNPDPRYMLGYLRGEIAAEEAENGSEWVTYP